MQLHIAVFFVFFVKNLILHNAGLGKVKNDKCNNKPEEPNSFFLNYSETVVLSSYFCLTSKVWLKRGICIAATCSISMMGATRVLLSLQTCLSAHILLFLYHTWQAQENNLNFVLFVILKIFPLPLSNPSLHLQQEFVGLMPNLHFIMEELIQILFSSFFGLTKEEIF